MTWRRRGLAPCVDIWACVRCKNVVLLRWSCVTIPRLNFWFAFFKTRNRVIAQHLHCFSMGINCQTVLCASREDVLYVHVVPNVFLIRWNYVRCVSSGFTIYQFSPVLYVQVVLPPLSVLSSFFRYWVWFDSRIQCCCNSFSQYTIVRTLCLRSILQSFSEYMGRVMVYIYIYEHILSHEIPVYLTI